MCSGLIDAGLTLSLSAWATGGFGVQSVLSDVSSRPTQLLSALLAATFAARAASYPNAVEWDFPRISG